MRTHLALFKNSGQVSKAENYLSGFARKIICLLPVLILATSSLLSQSYLIPTDAPNNIYPITITDLAQKTLVLHFTKPVIPGSNMGHTGWSVTGTSSGIYRIDASGTNAIITLDNPITFAERSTIFVSYNAAFGDFQMADMTEPDFVNESAVNNYIADASDFSNGLFGEIPPPDLCAPVENVEVEYNITITPRYRNSINYQTPRIYIRWQYPSDIYKTQAVFTEQTIGSGIYQITEAYSLYPDNTTNCTWDIQMFPYLLNIGNQPLLMVTQNAVIITIPNYKKDNGTPAPGTGTLALNPAVNDPSTLICAGSDISAFIFTDATVFDCQLGVEPNIPNIANRHVQYVYGTQSGAGIPNVFIDVFGTMVQVTDMAGNSITGPWTVDPTNGTTVAPYTTPSGFFEGPVVQYTWDPGSKLLITPLAQTYPIFHTGNIGTDLANDIFDVTLHNWGPCNAWQGDYFSSDPPVTEFSRLRLIVAPLAPTIPNVTVCGLASQTLTVTSPVTGQLRWYSDAARTNLIYTGGVGENTYTPSLPVPSTTTLYVAEKQVTGSLCEGPATPVTITIYNSISSNTISAPQTICSNTVPVGLTGILPTGGDGSYLYLWESSNIGPGGPWSASAGINNNQNYTPPTALTQDTWYRRVVTSGPCTDNSSAIMITVNPLPAITNMSATTCSGGAFTVTPVDGTNGIVPIGTTYSWPAPAVTGGLTGGAASAGNQATISGTLTNPTNMPQTATYTVTPFSGGICVGSVFTVTVTVNPIAEINNINSTVCSSSPFTITPVNVVNGIVPAGTTYSWPIPGVTGGITGGVSGANSVNINGTLTNSTNNVQTATYTVNPISGSCTGPAFTVTITVNPTGQVNDPPDEVVCNGGMTSFVNFSTVNTGGTSTYTWTNDNISIGLAASGMGNIPTFTAVNPSTAPVVATITVTPHFTNNAVTCDGPPQTFTITVNPTGQVNDPADQIVCNGSMTSSVNFSTLNTGGVSTYSWANDNPSIGIAASGVGNIPTFTGANSGTVPVVATITVTPTFTNGAESCAGPAQLFTITVNPSPSTSVITGNQTPACNETNVVYSVTLTAGSNYTWDVPPGALITAGATGPNNNSITVDFGANNGNISVIETLPSSCTGNQVTLPVSLQGCGFMADFSASSISICNGTSVTFTNLSTGTTGSTTYSWNFGAGASPSTISGAGPHVVTYTGTGTSTVSLTITDGSTDTKTIPNYITVNPLPVTSAIAGEALLCQNAANKIYQVVQNPGSQYSWSVPANITKTFDAGIYFIHADANNSGTGDILVIETITATGCVGLPVILNVTVSPTITGSVPAGPATVCKDAAGVIFSIPQNAGSVYSWSLPPGAFITGDPVLNQVSVTFPMAVAGNVSVVETNGACTTYHIPKTITINPLPVPSISAPPIPPRVTSVNNVYSTEPGMSDYFWSISAGGSIISGGSLGDNFVNITWNSTGNQTVSVNYINPVTSCTAAAPTVNNSTIFPLPTANNVSISGSTTIGSVLTGSYSYVDGGGGSEGTSTYRWLRNGSVVVGTALTYTTVTADLNKTLTFEVTPISNTGNPNAGISVKSTPTLTIEDPTEIPVASEVCIEGVRGTGNIIRGKYKFTHSRPEGISLYQWYNGSTPIPGANSIQYVLQATDITNNSDIFFEVTPVSSNTVPNTGTPVKSNSFAKFTLPQSEYSDAINSVALTASPVGGIFSGPYITNGIFSPKQAGAGGPYSLQYFLNIVYSSTSCSQQAIKELTVVPNTTSFSGFDAAYCKDGSNDVITITDYPPASTSLGFSITVPDAIVSQTAWTVTIDPKKMKAGINKDILTFRYSFGGYDYTITHPFVIDSVGTNLQLVNLNSEYCDNSAKQTISLTGIYPSGGTGEWTGTILSDKNDISSSIEASLGAPGVTYPITYRYTSPLGCKSQILTSNVTIKPSPAVQAVSTNGPLELCLGDFVTLSVTNTPGYHYQWKREGNAVGSDLNEFTATSAGTYSLVISNTSGCSANSSNTVNVSDVNYQLTTTFKVNGSTSFCQGGNVELSVTNNPAFAYQWQKDGTDITEATTNTYIAQYSGIYSLLVRNSNGCSNKTEDVNVIVSNIPVAPLILAGGPLVFCQDDSVILSVTNTPGYTYHWKQNDNSTGTNLNSFTVKSTGTYSLVVSNTSGCVINSVNTLNVSVNPKPSVPAVNISGPTSFCEGGNVVLSIINNSDYKYQWQKDGSDIPDATTNTYSAKDEGAYSLNVINSSLCISKTEKVNLNVSAVPTSQSISTNGLLELCLGDSTILSVAGTEGYTYQWKRNGQHIGTNLNSLSAKSSGTYSLVISNSSGCSVNTVNTVDITDANSQLTTTFKVSGSTSFCRGNSVELSVSDNPEYKYQWQKDGSNITGAIKHIFSAQDSGIYCLNVINSKGCKNKTEDVKVIVYNTPAAPLILAEGSIQLCQGDSVILSMTNTPGYSYQWKLNDGAVGTNSSKHWAKSSGTYTLNVSNNIGCSASSTNSVPVTVNPLPVIGSISQIGNDTKFCRGESITLSVPMNESYSYFWKNKTSVVEGETANLFIARESGEYTVEVTTESGCKKIPDPVSIEVIEMPAKPSIDPGNYYPDICLGENPLRLSVKDTAAGYNYKWYKNGTPYSVSKYIDIQEGGIYNLEANIDICTSARDSLIVKAMETLPKPDIIAHGPTVWYLSTSSKANYYKWYYNGSVISDEDNKSYIAHQNLGIYRVGISNDTKCFSLSDTLRIPTNITGIEDIDPFENVKIFPNPTNGLITIEMINNVFGEVEINILTLNGRKIRNIKSEKISDYFTAEVDLSDYSSGVYIINLSVGKYSAIRKIVVR